MSTPNVSICLLVEPRFQGDVEARKLITDLVRGHEDVKGPALGADFIVRAATRLSLESFSRTVGEEKRYYQNDSMRDSLQNFW